MMAGCKREPRPNPKKLQILHIFDKFAVSGLRFATPSFLKTKQKYFAQNLQHFLAIDEQPKNSKYI